MVVDWGLEAVKKKRRRTAQSVLKRPERLFKIMYIKEGLACGKPPTLRLTNT